MPSNLDEVIYNELERLIAANVDRHLKVAREWFPHDYVPWDSARGFDADPWNAGNSRQHGFSGSGRRRDHSSVTDSLEACQWREIP